MATAGPMATPTDADILTLTQWLSPAYPIGGYAYSHGLEWAIESGVVASVCRHRWLDRGCGRTWVRAQRLRVF